MKTQISNVDFINGIFPLELPAEHMPVSLYIDDLKDGIVKLSEMMVTMPKEEREAMSEILVHLSGACKLLSDMRTEVLRYSATCGI